MQMGGGEVLERAARALQPQPQFPLTPDCPHLLPSRRIPAVPDMRFEQGYLTSIKPYVKILRVSAESSATTDEKGKGKEVAGQDGDVGVAAEVITIQWGRVLWITTRDQVVSPFFQGALRGLASVFVSPLLADVGARFRTWWSRGAYRPGRPAQEGHGVSSLRNWVGSFTVVGGAPRLS